MRARSIEYSGFDEAPEKNPRLCVRVSRCLVASVALAYEFNGGSVINDGYVVYGE
jgi:hypothetical protein